MDLNEITITLEQLADFSSYCVKLGVKIGIKQKEIIEVSGSRIGSGERTLETLRKDGKREE